MNDVVERTVKLVLDEGLQSEIGKCVQLLDFVTEAYPTVDSVDIAELAAEDRQRALLAAKTIKARRDVYISPAQQIIDAAKADFNPAIQNAEAAAKYLSEKLVLFSQAEEKRIAAERAERDRLEREARQKAEAEAAAIRAQAEAEAREKQRIADEAERQRKEAEAKGDAEAAAKAAAESARAASEAQASLEAGAAQAGELILRQEAERAPEPAATKVAGFGTAKNWKAVLETSEEAAIRAIVAMLPQRPEFMSFLSLNMDALHKQAKAHESKFNVPGLRAQNFPTARSAKGAK